MAKEEEAETFRPQITVRAILLPPLVPYGGWAAVLSRSFRSEITRCGRVAGQKCQRNNKERWADGLKWPTVDEWRSKACLNKNRRVRD